MGIGIVHIELFAVAENRHSRCGVLFIAAVYKRCAALYFLNRRPAAFFIVGQKLLVVSRYSLFHKRTSLFVTFIVIIIQ